MKFFTPYKKKFIKVNADDLILAEETEKFNAKNSKLAELLENNPLAHKIWDGSGITAEELAELEGQLKTLNPALTIGAIQEYQKKDFIEFLLDVMDISHKENPRELIEKRFEEQIIKNHNYNARQIEFLILLKKVFAYKKHLELTDLTKMPLSEKRPLDNFSVDELKIIVKQANKMKLT
jgi:type I restriction enzyme R subunit